ncbi:MAG: energy-coupling factor transporter transmembrane protein EcfT, partial [Lachnospiraceae bacterium]|nr:energy-coupling factor transporter transmembrane protein EcfT [Lachnospiraceae bacterium]
MIRDITIGQFYPAKSILHRLDPRVKIASTLLYLVSLFVFNNLCGYILATIFLFTVVKLSKVPVSFILKGIKPIVFLLIFTVILNVFLTRGGAVLFSFSIFTITENGLRTAVFMGVRLIYLIMGSSLMTFTTSPNQLTDGMEALLKPLSYIKVPVHEIAMMMSIALRFIPILLEETDK